MEDKQKVEIVKKAEIKENGEKKEIPMDVIKIEDETEEEKMEVDTETEKTDVKDVKPLVLKIEPENDNIGCFKVEGIDTDDDDDEEYVIMTPQEIREYMEKKISENIKDDTINPLLPLQKRSENLLEEIKEKYEDITRLGKALEMMYKNQERFLRQMEVFPKIPTKNVGVSVDLPLLLDSVPLKSSSKIDEEAVIKKDLPEAKVLHPSNSRAKSATPTIPNNNSILKVPSTISITPAIPSGISVTRTVPNTSSAAAASNINSVTPTVPKTTTTPTVPKASTASVSNQPVAVKSSPKLPPKPANDIECIDLTDDTPIPPPLSVSIARPVTNNSPLSALTLVKHPAPLPPKPFTAPNKSLPNVPPKPRLKISSEERGIVLQWDMPPCYSTVTAYSKLKTFDIFGYQEQKNVVINTLLWKKIGAVKAMTLPMACTLTQFLEGQKYHFAIRAVDIYDRCGSYSDPISIVYKPSTKV